MDDLANSCHADPAQIIEVGPFLSDPGIPSDLKDGSTKTWLSPGDSSKISHPILETLDIPMG